MRLVHTKTMELRAKPRAVASRRDYAPQSLRVLIVRAPNLLPRSLLDRTHAPEPAQHEGTTLWQPSKRRTFNGAANSRLAQRTPLRPSLLVPGVPPSAAAMRAQHHRAFQPSELNRELPRATYTVKRRNIALPLSVSGMQARFECRVDGGAHGFRRFSLATLRTKPVARGLAKPIPLPSATAGARRLGMYARSARVGITAGAFAAGIPRMRPGVGARTGTAQLERRGESLEAHGLGCIRTSANEGLRLVRAAQGRADGIHPQTTPRLAPLSTAAARAVPSRLGCALYAQDWDPGTLANDTGAVRGRARDQVRAKTSTFRADDDGGWAA
ncbi:hypothetical protein FB451DRAFT_1567381 [Mycena latifolia]|nr:hypothetical protein FB451DRAFT_1567381 [Mycena latifolia]